MSSHLLGYMSRAVESFQWENNTKLYSEPSSHLKLSFQPNDYFHKWDTTAYLRYLSKIVHNHFHKRGLTRTPIQANADIFLPRNDFLENLQI